MSGNNNDIYDRQQRLARAINPSELEVMGKEAATRFTNKKAASLNEAVISVVKTAHLSPEQVRRVAEFANHSAFSTEFRKMASPKVVNFSGGPADPNVILQELNSGGGGSVTDDGSGDYDSPPKTASTVLDADALTKMMFGKTASEVTTTAGEMPLRPLFELKEKLAQAQQTLSNSYTSHRIALDDARERLYANVKIASLENVPLGDVVAAWSVFVKEPEVVKLAFASIAPRLLKDLVFRSDDQLKSSMEKTAAIKGSVVNTEHPVVKDFISFQDSLYKVAATKAAMDDVDDTLSRTVAVLHKLAFIDSIPMPRVEAFTKAMGGAVPKLEQVTASKQGLLPKGWAAAKHIGSHVGAHVGDIVEHGSEHLLGKGAVPKFLGDAAHFGVKISPAVAAILAGNYLYDQASAIGKAPLVQDLASLVPTTDSHTLAQMQREGYWAGPTGFSQGF